MRRVGRARPLVHADRAEAPRLEHAHELQPDHLEQRDEGDDQPAAILDVCEQFLEAARLGFRQPREELIDALLHGNLFRRQDHLRPLLRALHDRLKRVHQAEQIHLELRLVFVARQRRDALVGALPLRRAELLALVQQAGRRLELLVLEEATDERVARILFFAFDVGRGLGARQQHLRLDVDERGGHEQELAGDVEIQLLHQGDRVEVLRRDERDRDVVDAHLVLANEVQQQIERPLEVRQLDRKGVRRRLEVRVHVGHRYEIFIASRTRSSVAPAIVRARFEPSNRISFSRSGVERMRARRSRIGAR